MIFSAGVYDGSKQRSSPVAAAAAMVYVAAR
jgi:hypothetical protein